MTKAQRSISALARFAADAGITIAQAVELRKLAKRAFRAGELSCSVPGMQSAYDRATAKLESLASEFGLSVDWPGLWPTFQKNGLELQLAD